jgi:predicted nucleic acid-binding protein
VRLVIADTGPINYLILIGHVNILPELFERIVLPSAVREELAHPKAPSMVQQWMASPPSWIEIRNTTYRHDPELITLDAGEEDAIALAQELRADLLLMDDREGVEVARRKGFRVVGTLTVLAVAAQRGLVNLADAFGRLRGTNFRYQQSLMEQLLKEIAEG